MKLKCPDCFSQMHSDGLQVYCLNPICNLKIEMTEIHKYFRHLTSIYEDGYEVGEMSAYELQKTVDYMHYIAEIRKPIDEIRGKPCRPH